MGSLVRVSKCGGFDSLLVDQLCLLCGEQYVEADRFKRGRELVIIFECQCDRDVAERIRQATESRASNRGVVDPCR
jgi:hypothetical protein